MTNEQKPENEAVIYPKVDITGIDKAELLRCLYNGSDPQGMGWIQYVPGHMSLEQAQVLIDACKESESDYQDAHINLAYDFDYLQGRVMKVNLGEPVMDLWLYDRDLGEGAGLLAISHLITERVVHVAEGSMADFVSRNDIKCDVVIVADGGQA